MILTLFFCKIENIFLNYFNADTFIVNIQCILRTTLNTSVLQLFFYNYIFI